jgi:hypothetical protein
VFTAEPVCSWAHLVMHHACETAGAARTRSSPRPLFSRARFSCKTSGASRRESAESYSRFVGWVERSDTHRHTGSIDGYRFAPPIRHVIASEAKQSISPREERMDCFVASLLAMTPKRAFASRGAMRPSCCMNLSPYENRGRGECRMPVAPAASCALWIGRTHTSKRVHRNHPAFPHAMVLTVSFVLSPVTGLCCHRRQRIWFCLSPVGPTCLPQT